MNPMRSIPAAEGQVRAWALTLIRLTWLCGARFSVNVPIDEIANYANARNLIKPLSVFTLSTLSHGMKWSVRGLGIISGHFKTIGIRVSLYLMLLSS